MGVQVSYQYLINKECLICMIKNNIYFNEYD
jgi:hypothetical protein